MTHQRIRLGVDFHTFDGIFQGSRSHLLGLYQAAIDLAPDIDFYFFLAQPGALADVHPAFNREHVHKIAMHSASSLKRLGWQLPILQRRHRLDYLHLQYRLPFWTAGPCLCTIHDVLFETHPQFFGTGFIRFARWTSRRAVRQAALTFTVSDYSRREIARLYGVDAQGIILTPNAVDLERFHPASLDGNEDLSMLKRLGLTPQAYLCSLGRLEPRKNHDALVRAYAQLGAAVPPLLIIGQRDFSYQSLFEFVRREGLGERVRILEDVDDHHLPTLLRHARLMVYPSFAEGFGMPVLEALASGVPVIASQSTSLPEVAGPAAWLVDPGDVLALAAAMREALQEGEPARQARVALGRRHAGDYDWQRSAQALVQAVREDFARRRRT